MYDVTLHRPFRDFFWTSLSDWACCPTCVIPPNDRLLFRLRYEFGISTSQQTGLCNLEDNEFIRLGYCVKEIVEPVLTVFELLLALVLAKNWRSAPNFNSSCGGLARFAWKSIYFPLKVQQVCFKPDLKHFVLPKGGIDIKGVQSLTWDSKWLWSRPSLFLQH